MKDEFAFPPGQTVSGLSLSEGGLTIRQYFVAKAMQGFVSFAGYPERKEDLADFGRMCCAVADAVLAAEARGQA